MRYRRLIPIIVVPLIMSVWFTITSRPILGTQAAATAQAAPAVSASTTSSGCVSYWYVSYSGTLSYQLINTDTDGLPLSDLYFSRSYNDPTDLSKGYLDFNRDGKSDIFSAVPIGGGYYRWRYSSGAATPWINLAYDNTPPDQLRFGDFNGDGYTDVFATSPIDGGISLQWLYSPGGANSFVNLASDYTPLDQLRFGDFNGDGRTDVFALKDLGSGYLGWDVSYSGTTNYVQINSATTALSEMQFGDMDGNGHTDVFTSLPDSGSYDWYYSPNGSGAYQLIASLRPQSVLDVILAGNFDSSDDIGLYHGTDVFYTTPRFDSTYQWWYHFYKPTPLTQGDIPLAYDSTPPDQLRFGDFNGDGVTDVFKVVRQCNVYLPLIKR